FSHYIRKIRPHPNAYRGFAQFLHNHLVKAHFALCSLFSEGDVDFPWHASTRVLHDRCILSHACMIACSAGTRIAISSLHSYQPNPRIESLEIERIARDNSVLCHLSTDDDVGIRDVRGGGFREQGANRLSVRSVQRDYLRFIELD